MLFIYELRIGSHANSYYRLVEELLELRLHREPVAQYRKEIPEDFTLTKGSRASADPE